ncbi:MAG: bifunctional acetaldehyde-CoA/alcohol dehydrogenase [Spirochaetes bacterium]|nr:bifunctional acetaldehyde-CoA/alcohol dehydrogenase [Spirochaetota bacterium]MBN2769086.1 bifunctional acetaldehyde-CoA/alcohol dehydrogenase [Spirochaetota bacterium]
MKTLTEKKIMTETNSDTASVNKIIKTVKTAQQQYSEFTQQQVDHIFYSAAMAANAKRLELAKMAVAETGMGIVEDKVIKNHFASEYIYNKFKNLKTCGIIEDDPIQGITKVAEPLGLIAGIIPTTNPTSTAIYKALMALKTRNGIIFSPHPRAKRCTIEAAKIVLNAAVKAGAPDGIIGWIEDPTVEMSNQLMTDSEINTILATGGPGMVKAAYSSGKPAIGVGSGNTPVIIDETADIPMAVASILISKTFDNGVICASEQAIVVHETIYDDFKKELTKQGACILNKKERNLVASTIIIDGRLNAKIVGQSAYTIAEIAGIQVDKKTKVLIGEAEAIDHNEPFAYEKLSPVLGLYKASDFNDALSKADALIHFGGLGHTSVLYVDTNEAQKIEAFGQRMKTGRTLINMPSSQGAIGDLYNFALDPSLTLGCGSWGGNSISQNVTPEHLINIKSVARRKENMLWFRLPEKIYFKAGSLNYALDDLAGKKRAFIVTDDFLYKNGYLNGLTEKLNTMGIAYSVFSDVKPDPTVETALEGAKKMSMFDPDVIIAMGGGSPMDAAKIMWLVYEHPETDFESMSMRFMDIRKRVFTFPEMGQKAIFVAIPTTSGTGSEVTPFAVITDEKKGVKYPIADYALTPNMAIVDADLVRDMPKGLTAFSGIDALTHALEAIVSVLATEYTTPMAMEAARLIFEYLPKAYDNGNDMKAREKVHHAANMAGMAFSNAFLGVCHSMAHKLGSFHKLPHGLANALLINEVIRFNSVSVPNKQGTFPQYEVHEAAERYARLSDYLGLGGNSVENKVKKLIDKIDELKKQIRIPGCINEAGVDESEFLKTLDDMAEKAYDDQCTGANPRYPLIEEIKDMYKTAFYDKSQVK